MYTSSLSGYYHLINISFGICYPRPSIHDLQTDMAVAAHSLDRFLPRVHVTRITQNPLMETLFFHQSLAKSSGKFVWSLAKMHN